MKILHTADWHIGKTLHKYDLKDEHLLFFDWLLEIIRSEGIDVLLIAGDVFDHSNPDNVSRKLYYDVLKALVGMDIKIIITGGNHDSVSHLQSSKEILSLLKIDIIGGVPENIEDEIIELKDKNDQIRTIVLAVPYLRDKDIRSFVSGQSDTDRITETKKGILAHYQLLAEMTENRYQGRYPIIAMGHLYLQGATSSESERDIQLGNLAGIDGNSLSIMFDYTALGHIHRPQSFAEGKIQYSGSPISLSFSERADNKRCNLIEIDEHGVMSIKSIAVRKFRSLVKLVGTLDEVTSKLEHMMNENELPMLVEIEVREDIYDASKILALNDFVNSFKNEKISIVKFRITFNQNPVRMTSLYNLGEKITDLSPKEVFSKRINKENIDEDQKAILLKAFDELLTEFYENGA